MVIELTHPVSSEALTLLRDAQTATSVFRATTNRVATLVLAECLRAIPTRPVDVQTPLAMTLGVVFAGGVVVIPILRAGLAFIPALDLLCPSARIVHVGLARDEVTAEASWYLNKISDLHGCTVFILDPMLATGGSVRQVIDACFVAGAAQVVVGCVLAAPEGLRVISEAFPDVTIVCGVIDTHLDEKSYIVPGLGDFGDRWSGT